MKTCSTCKEQKALIEFGKSSKAKDGLQWSCRDCKAQSHQENRERRLESIYKSKKWRVDRNRNFVYQYLLSHPCVECPEKDPLYLDFDHIRGKKLNNVSTLAMMGASIETLQGEIDKCQVLCVRCHRRKTATEGKWWTVVNNSYLTPPPAYATIDDTSPGNGPAF